MKNTAKFQRLLRPLPILGGMLLAANLGMRVVGFFLFRADTRVGKVLWNSEMQFIVILICYVILLSVLVLFVLKNKKPMVATLAEIDKLQFFSWSAMMLFFASCLLGMVMFLTLMFLLM